MARILLADDDVDVADALCRMLQDDGHYVDVVLSGDAALQKLREETYDIVITDVVMPENGGVVISGMARMLQGISTVIAISGYFDSMFGTIRTEFLRNLGVKYLVKKPIDAEELSLLVRSIAEQNAHS